MQETIESKKKKKTLGSADIGRVMKLLPHRYPFLMIDRLKDMDGDES
jgi:3-hydroxyacyl-[acyl-carrier-protein] dehydratase